MPCFWSQLLLLHQSMSQGADIRMSRSDSKQRFQVPVLLSIQSLVPTAAFSQKNRILKNQPIFSLLSIIFDIS